MNNSVDVSVSSIVSNSKIALGEQLFQSLALCHSLSSFSSARQIVRLEVPITHCTPLQWLSWQSHPVQVYWSSRQNDFEVAGIGTAITLKDKVSEENGRILGEIFGSFGPYSGNARYYGGMRFNSKTEIDEPWLPYGSCLFILPLFEVYTDLRGTFLACNVVLDAGVPWRRKVHAILDELEKITMENSVTGENSTALCLLREDKPAPREWFANIQAALGLFQSGRAAKIVLGRSTFLLFDRAPGTAFLLKRLRQIEPIAYHFCIQPEQGSAFIGASPERLYRRHHRKIQSEAVAGTRPRGKTYEEDRILGNNLLQSEKDYREHIFVRNVIRSTLNQCCRRLMASDDVQLLQQSRVQHLYSHFSGELREEISDRELLDRLHPTPAVGGVPRDRTLRDIARLEPFDRGWHAGPVGWIGREGAEFAVGIRSALLNGRSLRLFAGAGVVQGSEAQMEWEEMETKISVFMDALGIR